MNRTLLANPLRRKLALATAVLCSAGTLTPARHVGAQAIASDATAWEALRARGIVLFRHANAPGIGDPPEFRLGDCSTQRNLDANGRNQSIRIGELLRERRVTIGMVLASQWCRTRETAELAFPGRVTTEPVFNSFFEARDNASAQTAAARALLLQWKGPGALVVVTHQVNISALTGNYLASGEGIVLRPSGQQLEIAGRVQ